MTIEYFNNIHIVKWQLFLENFMFQSVTGNIIGLQSIYESPEGKGT